ncbi:hypothetical protein [uncultured Akkermansia sp.]|uniref:hypothetical protein n=1 Tax=uncultured Akkermansia sp. TaxID=512294 RepID=UPI00260FC116|nr:hypothetical protein [uncultured Akkermansia sp.]
MAATSSDVKRWGKSGATRRRTWEDRRGKTNVTLLGNPGFAQSVRGAKAGTTALQLGAGLSVPVGTKGTVFVNGNADIRDGAGPTVRRVVFIIYWNNLY